MLAALDVLRRVLTREPAVGEGAEHIVVRHGSHVPGGVEAGNRGFRALVHIDARCAVAAAKTDLRNVHLDHLVPVIGPASRMKPSPARALIRVQNLLDGLNGFFGEMVELQKDRPIAALEFLIELPHHLAAPVIAFDKAFALAVRGETAERSGHVGARGAVVVLDQRVDLEALEVRQRCARVISHRVAVAGVGGILVGSHQVSRGGQTEPARGAAAENHRLGAHHIKIRGTAIETQHAAGAPLRIGQNACDDDAIGDRNARAFELPVEHFLDVMAFRHRQNIGAHVMHFLDRIVARAVFLELHAPAVEFFDGLETVLGVGVDGCLIDDAVVGDGDFSRVLLGCRVAGDDGVIQTVHAHRDRAAAFDVGLFQQQHLQVRILFLCLDGSHGAGGATPHHDEVVLDHVRIHCRLPCALLLFLTVDAKAVLERVAPEIEVFVVDRRAVRAMRKTFDAQHRAAFFNVQGFDDFIVGENRVDRNVSVAERHGAVVLENEEDVARDEVRAGEAFA